MAFGFGQLPNEQRRRYFTYRHNQKLMALGTEEGAERLLDKALFSLHFADFIGRRFVSLADVSAVEALEFARQAPCGVFLKPRFEGQGRGVVLLETADLTASGRVQRLYDDGEQGAWILDERLVSHEAMAAALGAGLAPVRVVTGLGLGGVDVLWAAVTLGRGGDAVNYHLGGIMAPVDADTGRLLSPGVDKSGAEFSRHPETGAEIGEIVIPQWDAVVDLVVRAAKANPDVPFCGWDVGITADGPFLIEGNHDPGTYSMVQSAAYRARVGGLLPRAQRVFPGLR